MGLPPINGTESRLDELVAEVRGLRQDLGELLQVLRPAPLEMVLSVTGDAQLPDIAPVAVELTEPAPAAPKPTRKPRPKE